MKKITITTAKQVFNTSIRDVLKPFMEDPRVKDLLTHEDVDLRSVEDIESTLLRVSWTDIEYSTPTGLIVVSLRLTDDEGCVTLESNVDAYYKITYNMYLGYRDRIESIEYSTASVEIDNNENLKSRLTKMGVPDGVLGIFRGERAPKDMVAMGIVAKGATSYRIQQL